MEGSPEPVRGKAFLLSRNVAWFVGAIIAGTLLSAGCDSDRERSSTATPIAERNTMAPTPQTRIAPAEGATANWLAYQWETLLLRYPPDWTVKEMLYSTPPQQIRGDPPSVIGLKLYAAAGPATGDSSILIGGRQVDCVSLGDRGASRCLSISSGPLYTFSADAAILSVFDFLVGTIAYEHDDEDFPVLFPQAGQKLETNTTFVIRWDNRAPAEIETVRLFIVDIANAHREGGAILAEEAVPNTGSYTWTIPAAVASRGPYQVIIGHCEPIIPPPSETMSSCHNYGGSSDLFYILDDVTR
jgi:hypothetical protein